MPILVDECTPRKYVKLLQQWGYLASLVREHTSAGADDQSVIQLAQTLDAVLLTIDMDFSNVLNYPPENFQGIIVIRYQAEDEEVVSKTLKEVLENLYRDDLRGALVVINKERYRVRRGET